MWFRSRFGVEWSMSFRLLKTPGCSQNRRPTPGVQTNEALHISSIVLLCTMFGGSFVFSQAHLLECFSQLVFRVFVSHLSFHHLHELIKLDCAACCQKRTRCYRTKNRMEWKEKETWSPPKQGSLNHKGTDSMFLAVFRPWAPSALAWLSLKSLDQRSLLNPWSCKPIEQWLVWNSFLLKNDKP